MFRPSLVLHGLSQHVLFLGSIHSSTPFWSRILAFPGSVQGTGKFLLLLSILGKLRVELGWSKNLSDYSGKRRFWARYPGETKIRKKQKQHLALKEVALVQQYIQNYSFRDNTLNHPCLAKFCRSTSKSFNKNLYKKIRSPQLSRLHRGANFHQHEKNRPWDPGKIIVE